MSLQAGSSFTHKWTFEALSRIKTAALLPALEFHSDNGCEFINNATERWCKDNGFPFTRSRSRHSNDNCFVEQKNGAVVREYVGYDRLEGIQEHALLAAVLSHHRAYRSVHGGSTGSVQNL
jgi:transposase InsO family protein